MAQATAALGVAALSLQPEDENAVVAPLADLATLVALAAAASDPDRDAILAPTGVSERDISRLRQSLGSSSRTWGADGGAEFRLQGDLHAPLDTFYDEYFEYVESMMDLQLHPDLEAVEPTTLRLDAATHLRARWHVPFRCQERFAFGGDDGTRASGPMLRVLAPVVVDRGADWISVSHSLRAPAARLALVLVHAREGHTLRDVSARLDGVLAEGALWPRRHGFSFSRVPAFEVRRQTDVCSLFAGEDSPCDRANFEVASPLRRGAARIRTSSDVNVMVDEAGVHTVPLSPSEERVTMVARVTMPSASSHTPFLFFVVDRETGVIALMGRIVDPFSPPRPVSLPECAPEGTTSGA